MRFISRFRKDLFGVGAPLWGAFFRVFINRGPGPRTRGQVLGGLFLVDYYQKSTFHLDLAQAVHLDWVKSGPHGSTEIQNLPVNLGIQPTTSIQSTLSIQSTTSITNSSHHPTEILYLAPNYSLMHLNFRLLPINNSIGINDN